MQFPKVFVTEMHSVLFIKDILGKFNKIKIAADLADAFDIFDQDQAVLPMPEDVPAEIPRIIYKGKQYECFISLNQATLNFKSFEELELKDTDHFFNNIKKIIELLSDNHMFTFSRIGIIIDGIIETQPFDFLKQYLAVGNMGECYGYDLGFLFNPRVEGQTLNKWVKFKSDNEKIMFRLDFNTIMDPSTEFTKSDIFLMSNAIYSEICKLKEEIFEADLFDSRG